jgi:hypothetical protein
MVAGYGMHVAYDECLWALQMSFCVQIVCRGEERAVVSTIIILQCASHLRAYSLVFLWPHKFWMWRVFSPHASSSGTAQVLQNNYICPLSCDVDWTLPFMFIITVLYFVRLFSIWCEYFSAWHGWIAKGTHTNVQHECPSGDWTATERRRSVFTFAWPCGTLVVLSTAEFVDKFSDVSSLSICLLC